MKHTVCNDSHPKYRRFIRGFLNFICAYGLSGARDRSIKKRVAGILMYRIYKDWIVNEIQ